MARFITLTATDGAATRINVAHIAIYRALPDDHAFVEKAGALLSIIDFDKAQYVMETPEDIDWLIAEALA